MYKSTVPYPYLPPGRKILYVKKNDPFMMRAKELALEYGCMKQPTGAVIVKEGKIIASGTNAGKRVEVCPRVELKCPTGTGYEHCKITCRQEGHAEVTACLNAQRNGVDGQGADLYLYGHWWCCENCWNTMIKTGINNVFLMEGATKKFKDLDCSKL